MRTGLSGRFEGASESYADSRFSKKPEHDSAAQFEETVGRAYYAGGFDPIKDTRVEKASLV